MGACKEANYIEQKAVSTHTLIELETPQYLVQDNISGRYLSRVFFQRRHTHQQCACHLGKKDGRPSCQISFFVRGQSARRSADFDEFLTEAEGDDRVGVDHGCILHQDDAEGGGDEMTVVF